MQKASPFSAHPVHLRGFSTDSAAAALDRHPEHIRRLMRLGMIQAVKVGRAWLVPADEIARILREGVPSINQSK